MSARAATQAVGGFYSNDYDGQIGAGVESDDDGGMPPLPQKRYTMCKLRKFLTFTNQ